MASLTSVAAGVVFFGDDAFMSRVAAHSAKGVEFLVCRIVNHLMASRGGNSLVNSSGDAL